MKTAWSPINDAGGFRAFETLSIALLRASVCSVVICSPPIDRCTRDSFSRLLSLVVLRTNTIQFPTFWRTWLQSQVLIQQR